MAGRSRGSSSRVSLGATGRKPIMSRRSSSSAYGKGPQLRSDPRPINDKAFQAESMRTLAEYLATHGYSFPISPKLLPSGKEIQNMIEFLFHQVDPSFRFVKLEDDVPTFFKLMGYPCQISRSALYAAGSPHSWPNLLAALVWLVNLLKYEEQEAAINAEFENHTELLHEYIHQSYRCFMCADDVACAELDKQIEQQFASEIEEARLIAEEIAKQTTDLDAKLQELKAQQDPVIALEARKADLLHDVSKFNALNQHLINHTANSEKRLEQSKQQLDLKKAELDKLIAENQLLADRVSSQTVDLSAYEKITRELQVVEEELQSTSKARKEKEKETWDLEVLASKNLKELESIAMDCNHALRRLKVVTLDGNSFEIAVNPRGEIPLEMIGVDIKRVIRPRLIELFEERQKLARDKLKESTDLLKEIHVMEDQLQEEKAVNAQLREKQEKLEALYKRRLAKLEALQVQCTEIQAQNDEEEEKLKAIELEATAKLERAKQEIDLIEAACEREIEHKASRLYAVIEAVMGYIERVQSRNADLKKDVDKLEEEVMNNFVRTHKQKAGSKVISDTVDGES